MSDPIRISVAEQTQVGDARRSATHFVSQLGFGEERRATAAIIVTEMATNLARHAKSGEIILRALGIAGVIGVEILAIDRGPGIANLKNALQDGFSTSGTPGTGLGAIRRQSDFFDLFTSAAGTVVLSRLSIDGSRLAAESAADDLGVVCLPIANETACGDNWFVAETGNGRTMILMADGLGHGIHAAAASRQAVKLFSENLQLGTEQLINVLHQGLRGTRGAAVAVIELKSGTNEAKFAGVGNISGWLHAEGKPRSMVSHNGTAGVELHRVKEFVYPWPNGGFLILHSDGLRSQWQLQSYPGLRLRHPAVIAGVLYRDFRRERDDVSVLVLNAQPYTP